MAMFLLGESTQAEEFYKFWGIDRTFKKAGGLTSPEHPEAGRKIYLLQRKNEKPGRNLGKTTGWIHRMTLEKYGVEALWGLEYLEIGDDGLQIKQKEVTRTLDVDHISSARDNWKIATCKAKYQNSTGLFIQSEEPLGL